MMGKDQTPDYRQTHSMLITIDGQRLDDRLQGSSLTFEGAAVAFHSRLDARLDPLERSGYKRVYTVYASPSENPPPAFGNSIPLDVLYHCLGVEGVDGERGADTLQLVFPNSSLVFQDYKRLGLDVTFLGQTPYMLLVERKPETNRRIYHEGEASLLRKIGVSLRIPNPSNQLLSINH